MKQEFLKEIGLTDEQIQSVLNKHNEKIGAEKKNINDMTNKLETTETELSTIKEQLQAANTTIKDWETKYETDTKALKDALETKDYKYSVKEAFSEVKFTSKLVKNAAIEDFIAKGGKVESVGDYIKDLRENDPGALESETNNLLPTIVRPTSSGADGEIKTSLSEMMKMANLQNN